MKWISVDDFLPEKITGELYSKNVLATNGKRVLILLYDYVDEWWEEDSTGKIIDDIRWWIELPKPPSE